MTSLNIPQRQERREIRYPLHMPVTLKLAHKEMHARSENISLRGILLSSASLIPPGSTVEVAVGVATLPEYGVQLSARGKVLRVQPASLGNFSVAIAFERPFRLGRQPPDEGSGQEENAPRLPQRKSSVVISRGRELASAWFLET
jgi:hypothetical protein